MNWALWPAVSSRRDLAQRLNALRADEINAMKRRSLDAAKVFNADVEMGKLLAMYGRVLSQPEAKPADGSQ